LRLCTSKSGDLSSVVRELEASCGVQAVLALICFEPNCFSNNNRGEASESKEAAPLLAELEKCLVERGPELRRAGEVWVDWKASSMAGETGGLHSKSAEQAKHQDRKGQPLRFRASCVRDGDHPFKSVDAMRALGTGAATGANEPASSPRCIEWVPALEGYDVELLAVLYHDQLAVGLRLAASSKDGAGGHRGKYTVLPGDFAGPGSATSRWLVQGHDRKARLRPSTATLLLCLAGCFEEPARRDERPLVLLDPFAGIGTIPAVAACTTAGGPGRVAATSSEQSLVVIACDKDERAVVMMRENAAAALLYSRSDMKMLHFGGGVKFLVDCADARCLGQATGSVDVVVSDLPFGVSHRRDDSAFPAVLDELARLLRPSSQLGFEADFEPSSAKAIRFQAGRAVLLVQSSALIMKHAVEGPGGVFWSAVETRPVIVGGLCTEVVTLERSSLAHSQGPPL